MITLAQNSKRRQLTLNTPSNQIKEERPFASRLFTSRLFESRSIYSRRFEPGTIVAVTQSGPEAPWRGAQTLSPMGNGDRPRTWGAPVVGQFSSGPFGRPIGRLGPRPEKGGPYFQVQPTFRSLGKERSGRIVPVGMSNSIEKPIESFYSRRSGTIVVEIGQVWPNDRPRSSPIYFSAEIVQGEIGGLRSLLTPWSERTLTRER